MLVDPPALRAGFLLPAGDGALIEVEGDDNSLHRTAVGKQRHDCEHQPPRLVHPVEGGVFGLGEGPPTAFAAITALFVAMDHEVALSRTTVGAAAPVVTELLVRVHADTHPFFGGQRPKKDAAGPAYSSTQPSSTLPWGATITAILPKNAFITCQNDPLIFKLSFCPLYIMNNDAISSPMPPTAMINIGRDGTSMGFCSLSMPRIIKAAMARSSTPLNSAASISTRSKPNVILVVGLLVASCIARSETPIAKNVESSCPASASSAREPVDKVTAISRTK